MPYTMECSKCHTVFTRPFISTRKTCPQCGSRDLVMITPSKAVGCVIFAVGILLLGIFACDMVSVFGRGVEGTIVGSVVKLFWGKNIEVYRVCTLLVAILAIPIATIGYGIAFVKRR